MTVTCSHCSRGVVLPDPWPSPGYTCPHCHRPAQLPRMIPAPYPPPAPPAAAESAPRPVAVNHYLHDDRPRRSAFRTGFGGSMGCVLGGAAGVLVLCLVPVVLVFAFGVLGPAAKKVREAEQRAQTSRR